MKNKIADIIQKHQCRACSIGLDSCSEFYQNKCQTVASETAEEIQGELDE